MSAGQTASTAVATEFCRIMAGLLAAEVSGYSPWFYDYCGRFPTMSQEYIQYHRDLLALARVDVSGKRVLDAGCGFAPALIVYGLLGASELHGVEVFAPMVDTVHAFGPQLPDRIRDRLRVVLGSASELPYSSGTIDVVLSNEAMSHYLDVDGFLTEARRVLVPGGVLIIADSNNARSRTRRAEVFDLWERFETGFETLGDSGGLSTRHFALKRYEIITRTTPELPDGRARELALRTSGLTSAAVSAAAMALAVSDVMPGHAYVRGELAVDPDGQVLERLFDPAAMAHKLESMGFHAKAYGYWGGAKGGRAVRVVNRALQVLMPEALTATPSFRVVAVKTP